MDDDVLRYRAVLGGDLLTGWPKTAVAGPQPLTEGSSPPAPAGPPARPTCPVPAAAARSHPYVRLRSLARRGGGGGEEGGKQGTGRCPFK